MIYLSFYGKKNGRCCPTCRVTHCCPGLAVAEGVLAFADFFALMPPDNAATVAPGTDVSFPQDGPTSGTAITRTGPSTFNLLDNWHLSGLISGECGRSGPTDFNSQWCGPSLYGGRASNRYFSDSRNGSCANDSQQFSTHCTKSCWQCYSTNHHSSRWRDKACFSTPCYNKTLIDGEKRMTYSIPNQAVSWFRR